MDTKQVILELRTQKGMSQDELAEKVFVSRQAVSCWENGETVPNTETLKLLSRVFDVSINTLLYPFSFVEYLTYKGVQVVDICRWLRE